MWTRIEIKQGMKENGKEKPFSSMLFVSKEVKEVSDSFLGIGSGEAVAGSEMAATSKDGNSGLE